METIMPFYISPQTLKKQTKTVQKNWTHSNIKTTQAREILCQLYGYESNHHYQRVQKEKGLNFSSINQEVFTTHYKHWIQKLAKLGAMNESQAQKLIHLLWSDYFKNSEDISTKLYSSSFKFFGVTSDFLDQALKEQSIEYAFNDNPSVKDAIEAIGVPHVEVGSMVINGKEECFSYTLQENDLVQVYPHKFSNQNSYLPFKPKNKLSFLLDVHLGALARYLRMAGFDTLYESKDYGDAFLAEVASSDGHIMLSRDIGLLKRGKLNYGHWVRQTDPWEQFREIVQLYDLQDTFKPMSRCIKCNGVIETVDKNLIESSVPPKVYAWKEEFFQCLGCSQVYWKGSHYEKMMEQLGEFS